LRNARNILIGKPDDKGLFGINRRRCEANSKMVMKSVGFEGLDKIHLVPVVESCEPTSFVKGREFLDFLSDC
jgi:hypothetical protein